MSRILYYDCFSGISGDMHLGAMVDLGVDEILLQEELKKLPVHKEFDLRFTKDYKNGIQGTKADVILKETSHHHRTFEDIRKMIAESDLSQDVKDLSIRIFKRVAVAEGKVHGKPLDQVHFHEVGAVDSIVDIVGSAIGFLQLDVDEVWISPIQLGGGFARCAHGTMPVPAPATVEILKDIPVESGNAEFETTTPTGAAIAAEIGESFGEKIVGKVEKTGYGLGSKEYHLPNVLRVLLLETDRKEGHKHYVLETNIDDMNPEHFAYLENLLFDLGAGDVWKTSIQMKKSRLATQLSVLYRKEDEKKIEEAVILHTTTMGLRKYPIEKTALTRNFRVQMTKYGPIRMKQGFFQGKLVKEKPEYDDCVQAADKANVPLKEIYKEVEKANE
ncbi:MAG TPA: nickel pincer cofactor biosynthesis protein LarC [Eubacteriaceae bacterium]|nr:nickel pincer cofactor biosynthesis protein LarC [Eubacteriaceae bacterium]